MNPFDQKVAIVTGGSSGIGRALCEELSARGALVVVADIDARGAEQVAAEIGQRSARSHAWPVDVTNEKSVATLVEQTLADHGQLDYMFNNAGIAVMGEARDLEFDHWRSVVDVNLWGVVYGTTIAYRAMIAQGSGHIVNTASMAGLFPASFALPYCATKHAVVALSLALRAEAADLGVKVSVVCPGGVQSQIFERTPVINAPREKLQDYLSRASAKMMKAEEAALTILHGVAYNHAIIVFPGRVRMLWWFYRLSPALFNRFGLKYVRNLRNMLGPA
jgi:NAD(P)-dependent dehydrogenase (short-subunit alcohol dehydrogenase family)